MPSAAQHLRTSLASHLDAQATEQFATMEGRPGSRGGTPLAATDLLRSTRVGEVLAEAVGQGQLDTAAAAAMVERLVCVYAGGPLEAPQRMLSEAMFGTQTASEELARMVANTDPETRADQARSWLRRVGPAARRVAQAHEEALEQAAERRGWFARVLPSPQGGAAADAELAPDTASALLDATDDAAAELLPWLCRAQASVTWHSLLLSMRGEAIGLPGPVRDRFRRVAGCFRTLGFERDMATRLRRTVDRGWPMPRASVIAAPGLPHVHVAQGTVEFGLWSEMTAAEGVAAGLCRVLAPARLPVEQLPWAAAGAPGAGPALGGLWLQLWADGVYLGRAHGLSGGVLDTTRRHAAIVLLAIVRASAALAIPPGAGAGDFRARGERRAEHLGRALCCPIPVELAQLWSPGPALARSRCDGRLSGLALHVALREALDEDWFDNPRVVERLRGAAARAGSVDGWGLCEEQGGQRGGAAERLIELLP